MKHVMLDKETLGIGANAAIMSIGAVKFDLDSDAIDDNAFYASVSIDSNIEAGRQIDEATLLWWLRQSPEAQAVFHEPKQSLESALIEFVDWFGDATHIWSNGASFDIPMMSSALKHFDIEQPWPFFNERCVRTYKNLPGMKLIKPINPLKHNALQDAISQAKHMQAIQKKLSAVPHPMIKGAAA
jgi:DNA polymerase III epsilon subunit-like protein